MIESIKNNDHKIRIHLINYGVERLKRFGFMNVNEKNILEDEVYKFYFFRILLDQLGENIENDRTIKNIIIEISNE